MKPLDIVKTPKGAFAMVNEVIHPTLNCPWESSSIEYFGGGNPTEERSAWWKSEDLELIDNFPSILARRMAHPFNDIGKQTALVIFPITPVG